MNKKPKSVRTALIEMKISGLDANRRWELLSFVLEEFAEAQGVDLDHEDEPEPPHLRPRLQRWWTYFTG